MKIRVDSQGIVLETAPSQALPRHMSPAALQDWAWHCEQLASTLQALAKALEDLAALKDGIANGGKSADCTACSLREALNNLDPEWRF
jgi:hypothetical protein